MFGKSKTKIGHTIIGQGTAIEGELQIQGSIHIDGRIEGKLQCQGQLSIGPEGTVNGEVFAKALTIAGRFEGKAVVEGHLHLRSGAVVRGDLRYQTLEVERGASVHGKTNPLGDDLEEEVVSDDEAPPTKESVRPQSVPAGIA